MHLRPALPQIHEELTEDRVVGIRRYALLLEPRPKGIGKLPLGVAAYLIPSGSLPEPYVSVPIDRWIQVQPLMRGCVVEGDMRVGPNFPSVLDGCGDERLGSMVGVQELRVWLQLAGPNTDDVSA